MNREAMSASRIARYQLRTTDVNAARAFYADVLGAHIWGADVTLALLPGPAVARGAAPHWLGHVHVGAREVEGTVGRLVAQGGQLLVPMRTAGEGAAPAVVRDPFGALLGVSAETAAPPREVVAWHVLHTRDHERAFALYAGLFGWTATGLLDPGPDGGVHQLFAWEESGRSVGSVSNAARLPHIHPQWFFCFDVPDIEAARTKVRARGGLALAPMKLSSGALVAPCGDPQGAAFGLHQLAHGTG